MPDIEDRIRRAQEEGLFDNLSGKGKPFRLDQNPHEDPDWSLAYHMLRSSGYTLPWIEELREIESELGKVREAINDVRKWRSASRVCSETLPSSGSTPKSRSICGMHRRSSEPKWRTSDRWSSHKRALCGRKGASTRLLSGDRVS